MSEDEKHWPENLPKPSVLLKRMGKDDRKSSTVILSRATHKKLRRLAVDNELQFSDILNGLIEKAYADFYGED